MRDLMTSKSVNFIMITRDQNIDLQKYEMKLDTKDELIMQMLLLLSVK